MAVAVAAGRYRSLILWPGQMGTGGPRPSVCGGRTSGKTESESPQPSRRFAGLFTGFLRRPMRPESSLFQTASSTTSLLAAFATHFRSGRPRIAARSLAEIPAASDNPLLALKWIFNDTQLVALG